MPKDVDLVEYDQHLFEKQLDLEIMKVIVQNSATNQREVTREQN